MEIKEFVISNVDIKNEIFEIVDKINEVNNIAIIGHTDPDMDCIGSQLALAKSLKKLNKNVFLINKGPFETNIKQYENLFISKVPENSDLIIVVDNSSIDRISSESQIDFSKTIVIDHHYTNSRYGIINYVDDSFVSASEMVFLLILFLNIEIDKEIAQDLLNGILSDNGYYRHIRHNKYFSLLATYYLVELGGDPKLSYDNMFSNNKSEDIRLLGLILNRIETYENEKIVIGYMTESEKKLYNSELNSSLIFKEMMTIKNGKIFVFFKINEEEKKISVSFRSTEEYDVGTLAFSLGGGGHRVASGVTLIGEFEKIKKEILEKVKNIL